MTETIGRILVFMSVMLLGCYLLLWLVRVGIDLASSSTWDHGYAYSGDLKNWRWPHLDGPDSNIAQLSLETSPERGASGRQRVQAIVASVRTVLRDKKAKLQDQAAFCENVQRRFGACASELEEIEETVQQLRGLWEDVGRELFSRAVAMARADYEKRLEEECRGLRAMCQRWGEVAEAIALDVRMHESHPEVLQELHRLRRSDVTAGLLASGTEGDVQTPQDELNMALYRWTQFMEWTGEYLLARLDQLLDQEGGAGVRARLRGHGVEIIEPSPGEPVTATEHEEVATAPATRECPAGHAVRTITRGYVWREKDFVLRRAKVVVAIRVDQPNSTQERM